jgi:arylsulfatase
MPAAKQGLQDSDPTIAELLKPQGYATAQIGKNHLGDRNEYLPTVHGFDEFYGILYHLNAMEEPYEDDYPKGDKFHEQFGPRNIIETRATSKNDSTTDPRWGKVGKQTIKDGGPLPPGPGLDKKAKFDMTNVDEELVRRSNDFMERSVKAGKPFFLWHNTTRTHVFTHLAPKWEGKSGFGMYADAMMELDDLVGKMLKKVDDLGIADNTIVLFTSDNGAEVFTWPDGGNTPFRGEKGTTYEGGFRAPMLVKWPGTIKPGTIYNDIMSAEDWMPTLVAAAGDPKVKEKLLKGGHKANGKKFKNHLDGYNFLPYFKGEVAEGPRKDFFYWSDSGDLMAVRYGPWKISFKTIEGNLFTGHEASTNVPIMTNLRADPWERYQSESMMYGKWWAKKLWTVVPAGVVTAKYLQTFKDYPPSQKVGSFGVDQLMKNLDDFLAAQRQ